MKCLKLIITALIISFLISCKKDKEVNIMDQENEPYEINDNVQYYLNFNPDTMLNFNDSLLIDIDKNGAFDIMIRSISGGIWLDRVNDSIKISIGKFIGSGTANLDPIVFEEIIDQSQYWYNGLNLSSYQLEFIGLQKINGQIKNFGWVKIMMNPFVIDKLYYRKDPNTIVKAGIYNYN